jgi:hypothetical protein
MRIVLIGARRSGSRNPRGPLDPEQALATLPPADRVIVDRRVEAEARAADLAADGFERRADLIVSRSLLFPCVRPF